MSKLLSMMMSSSGGGGTPYLQSDGSAWCHMAKSGNITYTKWEIDCAVDNSLFDSSGWRLVFGYTAYSDIFGAGHNGNTGVYGGFNGANSSPINTYTKTTDRQIISTTLQSAKTSPYYYFPLFGKYSTSSGITTPYKMKIYSAKFYNGDTLVLDLVPKEVGGVAGMYDNISGEFFTNQGSGSFTYGEE